MNNQEKSSWGGAREGAGRKPKDEELKELALIDAAIDPDGWQRLIKVLFEKACAGNVAAAKLILERRFGSHSNLEIKIDKPQPGDWFED